MHSWIRVFAITAVIWLGVWALHEFLWIPLSFDLESTRIEQRLQTKVDALKPRFMEADEADWPRLLAEHNSVSDDFLTLIRQDDSLWPDIASELASGEDPDLLLNGADAYFLQRLSPAVVLRNDMAYPDSPDSYGVYGFMVLGLLLSAVGAWLSLRPDDRRLIGLLDKVESASGESLPGDDPWEALDGALVRAAERVDQATEDLHTSVTNQRDLLHAVAHEFRGPIARLRFAQDMLAERSAENAADTGLLRDMESAVDDLDALVSEVLGYSRIQDGGYRLRRESFAVEDFANIALDRARAEFPLIEFAPSLGPCPGSVTTDRTMADRALANVLRNAGRFAAQRVELRAWVADEKLHLAVDDDGPGIAPGKRERIFEPFTRLDSSRSRKTGGGGLGLAIVRAITRRLDGDVWCEDSSLGGARFCLTLGTGVRS